MTITKKLWGRVAIAVLALAALGFGGRFGYFQLVKAGYVKYNKYDRRDRGALRVGDAAPDVELAGYDGKPLFLVFGSCT